MSYTIIRIANTVAYLIMITVNVLANIIPIGIGNTAFVSEKYPNLFTPAPVTFFIWGVIYLLMALFVLYQWGLFDCSRNSETTVSSTCPWFILSCLMNTCWIFAWHFDVIWLSCVFIALLLVSLIILTSRLDREGMGMADILCVSAGFDIYLGWIIAATIANITVTLKSFDWSGFGLSDVFWMCTVLIVSTFIAMAVVLISHRQLSGLAVLWAYIGILIRHLSENGFNGKYSVVIVFTIIGGVAIVCSIFIDFIRKEKAFYGTPLNR